RTSSNPVFSSLSQSSAQGATQLGGAGRAAFHQGQYGQQGGGFAAPQAHPQSGDETRPMTIDDIVTKTAITLGLLSIVGVSAFYLISTYSGRLVPRRLDGGIGSLVTVLNATFGRTMDSAPVSMTYGAFEGLFVGATTSLFTVGDGVQGSAILCAVGSAIL